MNKQKITYYVSTILLTLVMFLSVGNYLFNHAFVAEIFTKLGYPTYLIYPLATVKILGLVAIWSHKSKLLEELAYAGFFYNTLLGVLAHVMISDGEFAAALVVMIAVIVSYKTRHHTHKL